MAGALFRPLTPKWGMQKRCTDGSRMEELAAAFIKPNDRLSSFERLEIYNRQYWFRVLDCLYDDYPGLRAIGNPVPITPRLKSKAAKGPAIGLSAAAALPRC